ncbi:MAG: amino acid adenylation domain-containing protein, partial [Tistlia sp.]|uniref:amino acid adenylation domain-containing protein n=1 Tax=Tistlia sp. TaxID=3057121 RepID=UPI0034A1332C
MPEADGRPEPIAIVGLSGYFPMCDTLDAFWQALDRDDCLIEEIPPSRFDWRTAGEGRSRWGGFIPDIAGFDPAFFGIAPGEAATLDPRQRLLLMSAYQTLADAGHSPRALKRSRTGVFVAVQDNEYLELLRAAGHDTGEWYAQSCLLANRLSYFFDFRGASEIVDAQCPGAAVAIHRAVSALRSGEIEQALVGAANLLIRPEPFALLSEAGQLSPTDSVASFGREARGHLRAECVATLLLKPLSRALADGDHVHALIRGSAVNYNGQGGASIAAPNVESHAELVRTCYRQAGIDPRQVRYIEAQGMGNALADLVEWQAFNRALRDLAREREVTLEPGACRIGTLKPTMGHGESASALAALFKIVRSLETGVIHKVLNFAEHHPDLEREGQPCTIATETAPWPRTAGPRLAGLHAYGMGGINAHLLIEEFTGAGQEARRGAPEGPVLIVLSAKSETALAALARGLHDDLDDAPEGEATSIAARRPPPSLADIAYTLQVGREELERRLAWVVGSREELRRALAAWLEGAPAGGGVPVFQGSSSEAATAAPAAGADLAALAAYWVAGGALDWSALHDPGARRVRLPVYPFDRQRYWIEPAAHAPAEERPAEPGEDGARRIRERLVARLAEALDTPAGAIDPGRHLYDFGIDSLLGMKLLRGLARDFGIAVQARDLVEHPTIEALARHLGRQLDGPTAPGEAVPPVPERPAPARRCPLSEGQKGLWSLQQLDPAMGAYNIPLCFHLAGPLDLAALEQAFRALPDRHPLLGSRLLEEDGVLLREARPEPLPAIERHEAAGLGAEALLARIKARAKAPFDLEAGPLARLEVFSRAPEDHHLLLTLHHLVFDGGSFLPVCRSLFGHYREILQGLPPAPAAEADDYADFVAWEQALLAGPEGEAHRAYWREQLAGSPPATALPTDFPRAAARRFEGQTHRVRLDPALSRRLRAFARERRMTLSTVFLGLFAVVLQRWTGQDDLIVGMPDRGRSEERFETAVGYFVNMLPLRARNLGAGSFEELLRALQLTLADALDHAAYPFAALVRDLGLAPSEALAPVFQVAFEYQNAFSGGDLPAFARELGEPLSLALVEEVAQEGEYELVLEVREGAEDFALNLKFNPSLFLPATVEALAGHLVAAAGQAVADPARRPGDFDLLGAAERTLLLETWNDSAAAYPELRFHQLFEEQARLRPQALAVVCGERQLTYAELDAESARLAARLRRLALPPEPLVAVCLERSLDLPVALLAVARAGAAWLPLDPGFPDERLGFMLQDSGARAVLTHSSLAPKLRRIAEQAGIPDLPMLCLDEPAAQEELAARPEAALAAKPEDLAPGDLAYVIYTSGSTGRPKGVMVEHRALTNFLAAMAERPGLGPDDRLLAVTTPAFDISALELLLPLVRGGLCCLCPAERLKDPDLLRQEIRRLRPTVMQATPSTWSLLFHGGWRNEEGVRILCGGEPLPQDLRQQFLDSGSEAWNLFGPTETTIWSTVAKVAGAGAEAAPLSIGRPIANTQVYILDREGRLAPRGAAGELCIGGEGLARGYLNRPALTAERFLANPFVPGARLYRTGDLARWRADGLLEHLGRLDHQVKIRGHRIELEEIESRLDRHAAVRQSVVVAREAEGGRQLVAYLVAQPGRPAPAASELKRHLAEQLPDYMLPAHFVALPALPLTANGKTDRLALARREPAAQEEAAAALPRSAVEREVLEIWRALLGVGPIGVADGFFERGGDSVSAVILARRIAERFEVRFRAPDLFRHPSVRDIARYVTEARRAEALLPAAQPAAPVSAMADAPESGPQAAAWPDYYRDSLAIVGLSCHLPGARTPAEFWDNLRHGRESATRLSPEELRRAGVPEALLADPNFLPLQYSMEGKELFDPAFFNISQKNAVFMDPQFRMLLQHSWQAIEDAGYAPEGLADTAVFMSASSGFYRTLLHNSGSVGQADAYAAWIAGQAGTIPTMISYQLGLKGPSLAVHSNCSSSLVGLYLAQQALRSGEARAALVGGATLFPVPGAGHLHLPGMNFSSDGHCRAFDAAADGLVGGEGVVVVLVKRALDAIEDGDHLYALLRGVAVNNDGADKAGFYAPSVAGQAAVIDKVLQATGVDPASIGYVEAHGTGTRLGDPVEVMALDEAYRRHTDGRQFCGLGSVKPNIGHLDSVAGLAGLAKVALSLGHAEIPPSINFATPNPEIDFAATAFRVVDRLSDWPAGSAPRRAALSSFGIGGTNAHAVLEEFRPPERVADSEVPGAQLVLLSARTEEQLQAQASRLLAHLRDAGPAAPRLEDVAYTLQVGRKAMAWRLALEVASLGELVGKLEGLLAGAAPEGLWRGQVGEGLLEDAGEAAELVAQSLARGRLDKVARAWVGGLEIDWPLLHRGMRRRVSLPTYPFAEERYWVETAPAPEPDESAGAALHRHARVTAAH